jgi:hypothetical protein
MGKGSALGASGGVDLHLGLSPPGGPSRVEAAVFAPATFDFQMDTERRGRHELADQRPRELATIFSGEIFTTRSEERKVCIYIYIIDLCIDF